MSDLRIGSIGATIALVILLVFYLPSSQSSSIDTLPIIMMMITGFFVTVALFGNKS